MRMPVSQPSTPNELCRRWHTVGPSGAGVSLRFDLDVRARSIAARPKAAMIPGCRGKQMLALTILLVTFPKPMDKAARPFSGKPCAACPTSTGCSHRWQTTLLWAPAAERPAALIKCPALPPAIAAEPHPWTLTGLSPAVARGAEIGQSVLSSWNASLSSNWRIRTRH